MEFLEHYFLSVTFPSLSAQKKTHLLELSRIGFGHFFSPTFYVAIVLLHWRLLSLLLYLAEDWLLCCSPSLEAQSKVLCQLTVSHLWLLFAFSGRLQAGRSRRRKSVDYMAVGRELQVQAVCVRVSNQALCSTTSRQPVPVFLLYKVSAFWLLQGEELITMSLTLPADRHRVNCFSKAIPVSNWLTVFTRIHCNCVFSLILLFMV